MSVLKSFDGWMSHGVKESDYVLVVVGRSERWLCSSTRSRVFTVSSHTYTIKLHTLYLDFFFFFFCNLKNSLYILFFFCEHRSWFFTPCREKQEQSGKQCLPGWRRVEWRHAEAPVCVSACVPACVLWFLGPLFSSPVAYAVAGLNWRRRWQWREV